MTDPREYILTRGNKFTYSINRSHDVIMRNDAKENRYVIVSDIPGAFIQADMKDNVHMLLEGTLAEMIVN